MPSSVQSAGIDTNNVLGTTLKRPNNENSAALGFGLKEEGDLQVLEI